MSSLPGVDWPDDTLQLMRLAMNPRGPLKPAIDRVVCPVTVPVLTDDVELYCVGCGRWSLVDEWEQNGDDFLCPVCFEQAPPADEYFERRAVGLFTAVLPVPPRHYKIAFDSRLQAVNAIAACRMARRTARRAGLEPA